MNRYGYNFELGCIFPCEYVNDLGGCSCAGKFLQRCRQSTDRQERDASVHSTVENFLLNTSMGLDWADGGAPTRRTGAELFMPQHLTLLRVSKSYYSTAFLFLTCGKFKVCVCVCVCVYSNVETCRCVAPSTYPTANAQPIHQLANLTNH